MIGGGVRPQAGFTRLAVTESAGVKRVVFATFPKTSHTHFGQSDSGVLALVAYRCLVPVELS